MLGLGAAFFSCGKRDEHRGRAMSEPSSLLLRADPPRYKCGGTSCAVVQGHLRNRLGQSDRIAEFSEHTEGLRAFEWIRKKRIVLVQKENTVMPSWDQLQHCKWFYTGAKCGPCYELEWEQRLSESSWAAEHFPCSRQCKKSLVTVFGQTGTCCWELGFSSGGRCSWPLFCKKGPESEQSKQHIPSNPKELNRAIYGASSWISRGEARRSKPMWFELQHGLLWDFLVERQKLALPAKNGPPINIVKDLLNALGCCT